MNIDLENDPLLLLHDFARQMRTRWDQIARKYGMTRAQWIILARLERQPGISQNELAAIAEVAPITIARLIDRLEEQGLVERCHDPLDRRIWRLRLTQKALPYLKVIQACRVEVREIVTNGLHPKALQTLVETLRAMKENLNANSQILELQLTDDDA